MVSDVIGRVRLPGLYYAVSEYFSLARILGHVLRDALRIRGKSIF